MTNQETITAECTVLFADLAGSTQLYERVGDARAFELVDRCLQAVKIEISQCNGRVVKNTGDGLMCVFTDPNDACGAVGRIHQVVRDLPLTADEKLAVRIGFHYGPVVENDNDVFGDTVNIAARLLELASPGRAITSMDTVRRLDEEWGAVLHPVQARMLRGVSRLTELFEFVCESVGDLTVVQSVNLHSGEEVEMRLYLGAKTLLLDAKTPCVHLGRDPASHLRVTDTRASRQHANIELHGDKFVLIDRSSNGTFVAIEGEKEFVLAREEVVLRRHGHIGLGRSCEGNPHKISFVCI
jgi:class 3 adenylate cyclase